MPLLYLVCTVALFQETFLSLMGLTGITLFLARSLVDALSLIVFAYAVFRNTLERRAFNLSGTNYEKVFFAFLIYSVVISIITQSSSLGVNAAEIFVLNRFIFIALTVPLLASSEKDVQRLMLFVWAMILLQLLIGAVQFIGGPPVIDIFRPNDYSNVMAGTDRSFTSNRGLDRSMLIGTVGDFISFAYVMCFGVLLLLAKKVLRIRDIVALTAFLSFVFLSGSRTIFLCTFTIIVLTLLYRMPLHWRLFSFSGIFIVTIPLIGILFDVAAAMEYQGTSFWALFRPELLSSLMNQRLGHALLYLPKFLTDPNSFFGLSPDRFYVADYVNQVYTSELPYRFLYSFADTVEDFYPSALISYYGIFGASIFYLMQLKLFTHAVKTSSDQNEVLAQTSRLVLLLIITLNLLSFGNQSFENRGLSLLFWITIGAYNSLLILRRKTDSVSQI